MIQAPAILDAFLLQSDMGFPDQTRIAAASGIPCALLDASVTTSGDNAVAIWKGITSGSVRYSLIHSDGGITTSPMHILGEDLSTVYHLHPREIQPRRINRSS